MLLHTPNVAGSKFIFCFQRLDVYALAYTCCAISNAVYGSSDDRRVCIYMYLNLFSRRIMEDRMEDSERSEDIVVAEKIKAICEEG